MTDFAPAIAPTIVTAPTIVRVKASEAQSLALLARPTGLAFGPASFGAVAPLLSTWLATSGNKSDFSPDTAKRQSQLVRALHGSEVTLEGAAKPAKLAPRIRSAWAKCAALALTMAKATTQEEHDAGLGELETLWLMQFPAPKAKDTAKGLTCAQRLEAVRVALFDNGDDIAAIRAAVTAIME